MAWDSALTIPKRIRLRGKHADAGSAAGGRKLLAARRWLGREPPAGTRCIAGVAGLPQSATGQAVLLTGENVPARIGEHYGPKPNPAVRRHIHHGTVFSKLVEAGKRAALLNAYPPRYFHGVDSGKRLYSSIPLAVTSAGLPMFTKDELFAGAALSADFTGEGWTQMLGFPDAPVLTPKAAGARLAALAQVYDFSLFEYWASDYAGHKQDMPWALRQLDVLDGVLAGLLEAWDEAQGLVLITSDHGNMEDLSTRRHTNAAVPALLIGSATRRAEFAEGLTDLTESRRDLALHAGRRAAW
jgi:hypothetical protein